MVGKLNFNTSPVRSVPCPAQPAEIKNIVLSLKIIDMR